MKFSQLSPQNDRWQLLLFANKLDWFCNHCLGPGGSDVIKPRAVAKEDAVCDDIIALMETRSSPVQESGEW